MTVGSAGDMSRRSTNPYDWLLDNTSDRPGGLALATWSGGRKREMTWSDLQRRTEQTACGMRDGGVRPGDRVVISLPNDETFVATFLACSGAGYIPVPAPTLTGRRPEAAAERLAGIIEACEPAMVVTGEAARDVAAARAGCPVVGDEEILDVGPSVGLGGDGAPSERTGFAFLQFTSGSTKHPRGVVVTETALAASCRQAAVTYRETADDIAVTWVPLFHDMGLITGVLRPLYSAYLSVLLNPGEFVRNPIEWLYAIDEYRATLSSAPDFAYELCVRKVAPQRVAALDLSCWRVARNAGEPIRWSTLRRFEHHLALAGLRPGCLMPSYGLAEATLTVTTARPEVPPLVLVVDADALANGKIRQVADTEEFAGHSARRIAVRLVSSGTPVDGTAVRVVGAERDGDVGEIWVTGPQLASGYWTRSAAGEQRLRTTEADGAGWYHTGDLGFLYQGHLFVLGRADDTITLAGRNHFPVDIRAVCAEFGELRAGRVAAFAETSAADRHGVNPEVRLCAELAEGVNCEPQNLRRLARRVQRALARRLDFYVNHVDFLPLGTLPVTTSGKVRTREAQRRYGDGSLPVIEYR
jgi:acyl-CoA synthetase (AMP-forming)/AMP-acid ligase II